MNYDALFPYERDADGNTLLDINDNPIKRKTPIYIVNQGGSRSSKTYSICQWVLLYYCFNNTNKTIDIVRKTLPSLKGTILTTFKQVLIDNNLWNDSHYKQSPLSYKLNGNIINFYSISDQQKVRGMERDILWINESNEINEDEFRQLKIRTRDKIFIDLNPSDEFSWVYKINEDEKTKEDAILIKSTYLDNPFLPTDQLNKLLSERDNEDFWNVFGLGNRGVRKESIYTNWIESPFPDTDTFCYGLDFGFNHPTALTKVCEIEKNIYVDEIIYQSWLTTDALIQMINESNIDKTKLIYCDSARPDIIQTLLDNGYNAVKSDKEVKGGITYIQSKKIHVTNKSTNIKRELSLYSWKKMPDGRFLEEPIKLNDDAMDSIRYAIYTSRSNNNFEAYGIW